MKLKPAQTNVASKSDDTRNRVGEPILGHFFIPNPTAHARVTP